jgi:hypothetical protein
MSPMQRELDRVSCALRRPQSGYHPTTNGGEQVDEKPKDSTTEERASGVNSREVQVPFPYLPLGFPPINPCSVKRLLAPTVPSPQPHGLAPLRRCRNPGPPPLLAGD